MLCISIINLLIFPVISSFKGRFHDNTLKRHRAQLSPRKIPPLATATYSSYRALARRKENHTRPMPLRAPAHLRIESFTVPTSSFCISLPCTRLRITCAKKVSQYSQHHHLVSEARPCTPNHAGMALMVGVEIRSTCGPKHFYHEAMGAHRASWKCNRSSLILMYGTTFPMAAGS
jgi:hypothetical protein